MSGVTVEGRSSPVEARPGGAGALLKLSLLSLASGLLLGTPSASAQERPIRTVARVVATSGVGGTLAAPVCHDGVDLAAAPFARVAPRLVQESREPDRPLIIDTGGLLTPGGVGRFAAAHQPEAVADVIAALGYRALAFSSAELGAPRDPVLQALGAVRDRGIPSIATNLFCEPAARALCEVVVDGSDGIPILNVGERRVAVVAFLPDGAAARVAPNRAEGVRIVPVARAAEAAVRRARAKGADLVVAALDVSGSDDGAAQALSTMAELPFDVRPDLVLLSEEGDEILFARPMGFRPAIVGSPPTLAATIRVRDNPLTGTYDVLARPLPPSRGFSDAYEAFIERLGQRYCARWGRVLRGARLDESIDGTAMLELTAGVMREEAEAELAVLNRGLLDPTWRPARDDSLTASDVYVALQYDEPLVVGTVPAEWLRQLAERVDAQGLLVPGLSKVGDDILVNGRPLEPRGEYRVATIRFLAAGGDGALPDGDVSWQPVEGETVRAAVLEYLGRPRPEDPRRVLPDPEDSLEWTLQLDADLSFAGTTVYNPARDDGESTYETAQLTRDDSLTFGFETTVQLDGTSRLWAVENEARASYRTTRTATDDFAEGDDVIALRSTGLYRGLREQWSRFYVPEPYLEGYLESEFTRPDERNFRHLLLRPTAGLRFQLTTHLEVKLAGGFERELLDPNDEVEPGGGAQLVLARFPLLSDHRAKLELALGLDYFITSARQTLRANMDTTFDLVGPFSLVFGFKLFGQQDFVEGPNPELGISSEATAALRVRWLGRTVP